MKMICAGFQRPDSLKEAFFQCPAYAHRLAGGLHLGGKGIVGVCEFIKRKPGQLGYDIIQSRFEGGQCVGKPDFVQRHAHADLSRNPGDGIARGFGGQCRGTGDPGIDLDQVVLERVWIQGELDVAAAFDLQSADDFQSAVPEHLVFPVCECLGGTDHDGIAGMNPDRIQVFHVTDRNGGVVPVAHHLVFDFLEALDALLH